MGDGNGSLLVVMVIGLALAAVLMTPLWVLLYIFARALAQGIF